jgi:hypothetical protein
VEAQTVQISSRETLSELSDRGPKAIRPVASEAVACEYTCIGGESLIIGVASMSKNTCKLPPALKHGIYSGIGLLPTEDPAEFQKFKQEIFEDYKPDGRSEQVIVEKIACLEWRSEHLSTYDVAMRARNRHSEIHSIGNPPSLFLSIQDEPKPRSPEEIEAADKSANKQARSELGPAIELVEIGDVATIENLEKELVIRERLDATIARLQKKFLHVRGIKSTSSSAPTTPSQSRLGKAA